ncbi:MAG: CDP-alcohol phosphatidyltransferase family protein [Clostridia bacterium]|nr:CDP-alcohol phosphatidyltransferase family protein [Clostridia bacterium]
MIGFYNPSVILTYVGLCTAIYGMTEALRGDPKIALLCLMVCGICDMFDGTIARKCKRSEDAKSFGIQIDSLCDLVCFGVFPAMLGYGIKAIDVNWFDIAASALFVLAAIIRLGYYNVQEINRTASNSGKREYYQGLPVTSVALLLPVFFLIDVYVKPFVAFRLYSIALLVIAIAFITPFKIKKPYMHGLIIIAFIGLVIFFLILTQGQHIRIEEGVNTAYASQTISHCVGSLFA